MSVESGVLFTAKVRETRQFECAARTALLVGVVECLRRAEERILVVQRRRPGSGDEQTPCEPAGQVAERLECCGIVRSLPVHFFETRTRTHPQNQRLGDVLGLIERRQHRHVLAVREHGTCSS